LLVELMPDEPEAHGLLALMLLGNARSAARLTGGELVLLDDQDRTLWDQQQLQRGRELLRRALILHGNGPYVIQAAIADLHLRQPRDWSEIAHLYRRLEELTNSPVVTMNRAIAVAELEGPRAGLIVLDGVALEDYRYYHSTRADLLRRLGRDEEAWVAYARALELTEPGPEQRFLALRRSELTPQTRRAASRDLPPGD
jgi:RNA polymerase sigma-70 factor, ECF subfamily